MSERRDSDDGVDVNENADADTGADTDPETEREEERETDEDPKRKLHPGSVPYRSLSRSVSTGSLFFFIGIVASPGGVGANLLVIGGMVLVGIIIGIAYEFAYYERFRYELTHDTFDVTSGVISRRDREVPLRRVQNVDVRQNVLQRAFGIAAVHVETAGGDQTEITLRYVDEREAEHLQRELRNGTPRRRDRDGASTADSRRDERETDENVLFEIQPNELAILSVFTIDPGASVLATIALSFASGFDPTTLIPVDVLEADLPGTGLAAVGWAILIFAFAAWILSAILTFSRYYGFRLTQIDDELHYERGFLQRYSGTIPLEKVQTLTIKESVPFRWFGYGSLAVETAGYAPGQSGSRGAESAIPIAERARVRELARSVEPFEQVPDLESSPLRARERYAFRYIGVLCVIMGIGYVLATETEIVQDWHAFAALLFAVPLAAHLKWANRGFGLSDRYFFAQTGFWRRTTKIVPHYRTQSVVYYQTIFQRRRRLASVTADTASSAAFFGRAATAYDLDAERALEVQSTLNERLQERLLEHKRRRDSGGGFDTISERARESIDEAVDGVDEGSNGIDTRDVRGDWTRRNDQEPRSRGGDGERERAAEREGPTRDQSTETSEDSDLE